jgi:hypothetical protein
VCAVRAITLQHNADKHPWLGLSIGGCHQYSQTRKRFSLHQITFIKEVFLVFGILDTLILHGLVNHLINALKVHLPYDGFPAECCSSKPVTSYPV